MKAEIHEALVMYATIMEQNPTALKHYLVVDYCCGSAA